MEYTPNSAEIIDRLRFITESKNDAQLAKHLGVAQTTLSAWKTRGVIPYDACVKVAKEKGISLDVIIFGDVLPRDTGLTPIHKELFEVCWSLAQAMTPDLNRAMSSVVDIYNKRVSFLEKLRGRITIEELIANYKMIDEVFFEQEHHRKPNIVGDLSDIDGEGD